MKTLDNNATKAIRAILASQKKAVGDPQGTYMPVRVATGRWRKGFRVITLSQESMGSGGSAGLTTLLLLHDKKADAFIPFGYNNNFSGIDTRSVVINDGVPSLLNAELQEDHATFASMWLHDVGLKLRLG